jgi:hypothetical protein
MDAVVVALAPRPAEEVEEREAEMSRVRDVNVTISSEPRTIHT